MKGAYTKRKLNKLKENCKRKVVSFCYNFKRFFVKRSIKNKNFTIISNNCWAGRVYQYLDMPYLSPTAGLYFFAPDYIKFVSDLKKYLDTPLEFIKAEESKYFEELKTRNQLDKPIGILNDVEIVFLHYKSQEEALEKWNRRKERVNFDNILFKFSRMDLCTEKEMKEFDALPYENKILINNQLPLKYKYEVYWNGEGNEEGIYRDTEPFPGNIDLRRILKNIKKKELCCMFLIEKLYEFKKWISEKYKRYLTIEGKYTCILPDKMYLKKVYKARTGKKLNLKNPTTFTEKSNWLKLYDRNPLYTIMADKYKAREYIAEKVGEEYLVPLLGVWDSPDEIDFDALPDQFVLKCNHDNGVIICKDKSQLDIEKVKKELSERLKRDYYKKYREWTYKNITRKIICEKYMENSNNDKSIEYKFYCFNGVPKAVLICSDRTEASGLKLDMYDMSWNYLSIQQDGCAMAGDTFEKPTKFSELCELANVLSKGTTFVRVDFNCWDSKLYFGELTFFDSAGYSDFNPKKWDEILGSWMQLPKKRRR